MSLHLHYTCGILIINSIHKGSELFLHASYHHSHDVQIRFHTIIARLYFRSSQSHAAILTAVSNGMPTFVHSLGLVKLNHFGVLGEMKNSLEHRMTMLN